MKTEIISNPLMRIKHEAGKYMKTGRDYSKNIRRDFSLAPILNSAGIQRKTVVKKIK